MSDDLNLIQDDDSIDPGFSEFEASEFDVDGLASESVDDGGGGELEAAYLKALSALEASESEITQPESGGGISPPMSSTHTTTAFQPQPHTNIDHHFGDLQFAPVAAESANQAPSPLPEHAERIPEPHKSTSAAAATESIRAAGRPPTPRQIIEACLFVGGPALTSKRLSGILRGEFDSDFVEREIDAINHLYAAESRPYEIQMGEGGYRLTLREEFERIRYKVYGLGPKEVRLSQEALEVLAVVAYHQPIKQSHIEELGKTGCGPVLRQLVRRELIAVERDPAHPRDVNYKTTRRFLSLFDIRSLDELPRHEQVSYK